MIPEEEYKEIIKKVPIVCVDIIVMNDEGWVSLLLRDQEPAKGDLWFPGGRVNLGESIQEAAARHLQKDMGITIPPHEIEILWPEETIFSRSAFGEHTYHTVNLITKIVTHGSYDYFDPNALPIRVNHYVRHVLRKLKNKEEDEGWDD